MARFDLDTLNQQLAGKTPTEILKWAAETFEGEICLQSSMQRRSSTIVHMLYSQHLTDVPILFVDTGYHFAETLQTRDEFVERYGMTVITAHPDETPEEQTKRFGEELWRSPDCYEQCCKLRKVQPFVREASKYTAVISGLQRSEGGARATIPAVSWDPRIEAYVIYPLASWTAEQAEQYNLDNDVFVHPLHSQGFPSIGCETCTTAVQPGEQPRAGRWRHIREALQADEEDLYCNINWSDRRANG